MHRALRSVLLMLVASCSFLFTFAAVARGVETPQVTVFVYDDAQVSREILSDAEQRAGKIFSNAGFDITWRNCPCSVEVGTGTADVNSGPGLFLHITTHVASTTSDAVFGVAFLGPHGIGRYGDIFWKKVQELQRDSQVNITAILGCVMAHEMGHLLLGSNAHAISGIMQARWEGPELHRIAMGTLLFLPDEATRMRVRMGESKAASGERSGY